MRVLVITDISITVLLFVLPVTTLVLLVRGQHQAV